MNRPSAPAPFEVRRSIWFALTYVSMALLLAGFAGANLLTQFATGEALVPSILFAVLTLFFVWQSVDQIRDRRPLIVIGPDGLLLATASLEPIPWRRIWRIGGARRLFGGPQFEIELAPDIISRLKLGYRFMGEHVTRVHGKANTVVVFTVGLDRRLDDIQIAIRRYWPTDDRSV